MIPSLLTSRLILRAFNSDDAADVQRLAGDRQVAATSLNIPHPYADGVAESWIEAHPDNWKNRKILTLAVTTDADGLIGAISLKLDRAHKHGELGYWIGAPYWNKGYATEAATAVVEYGFDTLGLHRIHAHYLAGNDASGKVMEKLGMKKEGVLRGHVFKLGKPNDVILYGVLASDRT